MTVKEWIKRARSRLETVGIEPARIEAEVLAAHVLRVTRAWLYAHPDDEFPELAGETLLVRRESGEPLAYILGYREFYGRSFSVDPAVLIPRHETEGLVEASLQLANDRIKSVLDLGTGSGILAITLKLERPNLDVTACDISPEAIGVASTNARFHHAEVKFVLSDRFSSFLGESFDLIVSNPPYIAHGDFLPDEVSQHEPAQALWSGPTGLEFYESLAVEAKDHMNDEGLLALEVGHTQAEQVKDLFEAAGWSYLETRQDLAGIDRIVVFRWLPF